MAILQAETDKKIERSSDVLNKELQKTMDTQK